MADRTFFIEPMDGETEFQGEVGPTGVGIRRYPGRGGGNFQPGTQSLSAADKARLERRTGTHDPSWPDNGRVWTGEGFYRTPAQIEGDLRNETGNEGS